jgi:hypothetical protein
MEEENPPMKVKDALTKGLITKEGFVAYHFAPSSCSYRVGSNALRIL